MKKLFVLPWDLQVAFAGEVLPGGGEAAFEGVQPFQAGHHRRPLPALHTTSSRCGGLDTQLLQQFLLPLTELRPPCRGRLPLQPGADVDPLNRVPGRTSDARPTPSSPSRRRARAA
ncbi:hypothetical protein [Streptomyces sp. GSL17-111]|uniref:hypothetical protein n=1 Tax=Streptomyces sp. GSL17-111 TaxID=3121596 RepID=UPI0030F4AAE1